MEFETVKPVLIVRCQGQSEDDFFLPEELLLSNKLNLLHYNVRKRSIILRKNSEVVYDISESF